MDFTSRLVTSLRLHPEKSCCIGISRSCLHCMYGWMYRRQSPGLLFILKKMSKCDEYESNYKKQLFYMICNFHIDSNNMFMVQLNFETLYKYHNSCQQPFCTSQFCSVFKHSVEEAQSGSFTSKLIELLYSTVYKMTIVPEATKQIITMPYRCLTPWLLITNVAFRSVHFQCIYLMKEIPTTPENAYT